MSAPIFDCDIKGYDLKTELKQLNESNFVLKIMKTYNYDNVWAARNAYEKFFNEECEDDRRIIMVGDRHCMVVTLIEINEFLNEEDANVFDNTVKREYLYELSKNKYMRDDVLRMIETYDETSKNLCYFQSQINRTLDMSFEDMGMKGSTLIMFKRLRISCVRDLLNYWDDVEKIRKEGEFICSGKYLTKSSIDELRELLKANNMEWLLIREKIEEEDIGLPFD